ncbi:uncharacterized protein LOC132273137 [Cornus florida]|uniref:uncharacterized protein LOC132273137 n=1 Tax=Cornus florida TaxID=4283 RepID=UPI002899CE8A|nr:uncharacterized protein LOC132273137 [Cornus florida]
MKWRIGDGSKVNCWNDNWLPDSLCSSVTSPQEDAPFSTVGDLINHSTHSRNQVLISHHFNQKDRHFILQIPISLMGQVDRKTWGASKDGLFSVKSAYHVALSCLNLQSSTIPVEGCNFDADSRSLWHKVWKTKTYRKIQLFLWQSLHERILMNKELFSRWFQTKGEDVCISLVAFICWAIWKCRNDMVFERKRWDFFEVAQWAFTDFQEYQNVVRQNEQLSMHFSLPSPMTARWLVPKSGCFKINFDAAFNFAKMVCGGGIVLRNHLGHPVKVVSMFMANVCSLLLAEGLILRQSLVLLKCWGYHHVVVEGDCKSVMQLQVCHASQAIVFMDVLSLLKECLGSSLAWVPRGGNNVAHLLSKKALETEYGDLEWRVWPKWLLNALLPECILPLV